MTSPKITGLAKTGRNFIRKRLLLSIALLMIMLGAIYWGLLASDRYVSEAHVIVDKTELQSGTSVDLPSLLTGAAKGAHDMLLLRDFLRSVDMLKKLDAKLNLRTHYSNKEKDFLSRLSSEKAPQESFQRYYLDRVSIEIDDHAGVLVIQAQAYDAVMAQKIATALMQEGEAFLNNMAHQLAREQVAFLEQQVNQSNAQAAASRKTLIDYQNATGVMSPKLKAESLAAIEAKFEGQLSDLKARRNGMLGYLSPTAPDVVQMDLQIAALENQLKVEQRRQASPVGNTLNRDIEKFQLLEADVIFKQAIYQTSLAALEKGRVESVRLLKKLSVVQHPTLPDYPTAPRRIYSIFVFALGIFMALGIISLVVAIVRDHQD